jgi:hypothetical protein
MAAPSLLKQTTYAELLERCTSTAFDAEFSEQGSFTSKTVKGNRYWYFQTNGPSGRSQKYVGPETPKLLEQIARHRQVRSDERERRSLVSTLVRSFGLPRPLPQIGEIVAALAQSGVFRLRAVLVGTVAYQTYPAMLGLRLPGAALQTSDVDIAQFLNISIAIDDRTPPMLETLQRVDKTFRPVPGDFGKRWTTSYVGKGDVRVDFLTPNQGPDSDTPRHLPALQTDAQPLRYLDFLIHNPEPAALLHEAGVCVQVPAPERYAIHKLIVSRLRSTGVAKAEKDTQQAETLLEALVERRPKELQAVWEEASSRGPSWRKLMREGLGHVKPRIRDLILKTVGAPRSVIPGLNLEFAASPARYDFDRDIVTFSGGAEKGQVQCAISREALEDHFGADDLKPRERVEAFLKNRSQIEAMARTKYLSWPVETSEAVLLTTADVDELMKAKPKAKSQPRKKR